MRGLMITLPFYSPKICCFLINLNKFAVIVAVLCLLMPIFYYFCARFDMLVPPFMKQASMNDRMQRMAGVKQAKN